MPSTPDLNEYVTTEYALKYLARADRIPHRTEGEATLLEFVPRGVKRILDLGTGDGRLMALLLLDRSGAAGVVVDFSPTMLELARKRFSHIPNLTVVDHNLNQPLPDLGKFDAIVSSFAIHHSTYERKRALYTEIFAALNPGGVFYNLEHVSSATAELHERFLVACGNAKTEEDPSNKLASVEIQLKWLREIGFEDVDCHWKWMELALIGGAKASSAEEGQPATGK